MEANQRSLQNPFGMDEDCTNCPSLINCRTRVVHGFGDVSADFVFIAEQPSIQADQSGIPMESTGVWDVLERLNFVDVSSHVVQIENAYLTHLTRCREPDRRPTNDEIAACEPFLNADIRMINPEVIIPIGQRVLEEVAEEFTTKPPSDFDIERDHATDIRGRGFELFPLKDPNNSSTEEIDHFVHSFSTLLDRDYRQTKGRRGR